MPRTVRSALLLPVAVLVASLVALGALSIRAQPLPAGGAELVERHRCGACHVDLPQPPPAAPLAARAPMTVLGILRGSDSTHPDFALTEAEALAVALGVADAPERGSAGRALARLRRRYPLATPELGRRFARGLNCGGCHGGLPARPGTGPVLAALVAGSRPEWLRSYLRAPSALRPFGTPPGSGARMPDFKLAAAASDSIVSYLRSRAAPTLPSSDAAAALAPRAAAAADALFDLLSCRGCHQLRGRGGRIGPALDDVLARRTPAYIARMIREPEMTAPGSAMPRTADTRVDRVIALLAAGAPATPPSRAQSPATSAYLSPLDHPLLHDSVASAPADYSRRCAACHGARGDGNGYNARYLAARPAVHAADTAMRAKADDALYDGIAAGGASLGRSPEMPAFGATLRASEIRALVHTIRALCDCAGPAWAREPIR